MREPGGVIARVEPDSLAEELELRPGDVLLRVNGHPVRDVIDVRFYAAEDLVTLLVRRDDETPHTAGTYYEVEKAPDEPLGLEFESPVFDGVRRCANACEFCFVDQLPPGLRPSLYVKDDDLRYSFLFGNYLSLTNFTSADWDRLAEQRLSPLYVSVHTTDPDLRVRMFGHPHAAAIMTDLERLGNLGLHVHVQIVLCPGLNDGPHLERSLSDLAGLYPAVQSVGVVPVGLTRYHRGGTLVEQSAMRTVTPAEARTAMRTVERWHRRCRAEWDVGWAYASDELYLLAGRRIPARRRYDDFPQLENGVGLTRLLLDDCGQIRKFSNLQSPTSNLQLVCGTLIAPTLQRLVEKLGVQWTVLPVPNRFFGSTVTVSGLLTAADVLEAMAAAPPADVVVLPRAMFDAAGERSLDDVTRAEMRERLDMPVLLAETLSDVINALHGLQANHI
jgi:putative radical SAM enzyme (TIGR03279 family)